MMQLLNDLFVLLFLSHLEKEQIEHIIYIGNISTVDFFYGHIDLIFFINKYF